MTTQSEGQVLRTVPVSKITVREGFNPAVMLSEQRSTGARPLCASTG